LIIRRLGIDYPPLIIPLTFPLMMDGYEGSGSRILGNHGLQHGCW